MAQFIPGTQPLVFPAGTQTAHLETTWGMYINRVLNCTWLAYAVPKGTQIVRLPGIRSKMSRDFGSVSAYVKQRQATACGACGDS